MGFFGASGLGLSSPLRYNSVITLIDGVKLPRCTTKFFFFFFFWSPILFDSTCARLARLRYSIKENPKWASHCREPILEQLIPFPHPEFEKSVRPLNAVLYKAMRWHEASSWTRDLACPIVDVKGKGKKSGCRPCTTCVSRLAAFPFTETAGNPMDKYVLAGPMASTFFFFQLVVHQPKVLRRNTGHTHSRITSSSLHFMLPILQLGSRSFYAAIAG